MAAGVMLEYSPGKFDDFIVNLRRDPIEYISSNKLTEEDLLQCISKFIVTGDVEVSHRLQLLIVLQENASVLLTSDERLEVAVSNLSNYCEQLKTVNNALLNLKSQIFVTVTTVLLSYDNSATQTFASLLSRHCDQLWQILAAINSKDCCLLRETATECVLEIEESFPCLFASRIDELSIMCFKENLYPFQSYCNLISCLLKNVATVSTDSRTNEVLVMMKKLPLINDANHYVSVSKVTSIASKLLDFVPLLSTSSVCYVISNIVHLIEKFKLNPLILKTFIHRYKRTSDAILFRLLLKLKDIFQNSLFSNPEHESLMKLLLDKCGPVSSTESTRILALSYVMYYFDNHKIDLAENQFVFESGFYLPQPLDNLRIKEPKLRVFSKLFPLFKDKDWHTREFISSINGIYSQLSRDHRGYYTVALCRLLCSSMLSQNDPVLEAEYQRISLSVIKHHPQFSMHILNLMKKIKFANPTSMFFNNVLPTAVHHVTNLPIERIGHQLHHYLHFLTEAALENSEYSQPKAIVRFLQKVLNANRPNRSSNLSWLSGHALLNVCKHVLCFHNSNQIYEDMGEVLHTIITQNDDIDVRDRAQFYYMLLTTLSPKKITTMFQQNVKKSKSHLAFTNFAPGDSAYGIPSPVVHLNHPILCLTRVSNCEQKPSPRCAWCVDVNEYFKWMTEIDYSWKSSIECRLSIESHAECAYDDIYGAVLSFAGPSFCAEIPRVSILHLVKGKSHAFFLEVQSRESQQTRISVNAVFSTVDGQTLYSKLKPLVLEFHDLFQPLPVPSVHVERTGEWRKDAANYLWDKFSSMTGSHDYHQSVLCLPLDERICKRILEREFKPFVTEIASSSSHTNATVGIFLPPRNHLIMRIRFAPREGLIVRMATECQRILAQTNLYFRKLEKNVEDVEFRKSAADK